VVDEDLAIGTAYAMRDAREPIENGESGCSTGRSPQQVAVVARQILEPLSAVCTKISDRTRPA
jgi:hypothetical protein